MTAQSRSPSMATSLIVLSLLVSAAAAAAQDAPASRQADEQAIRMRTQEFARGIESADAQKVASFWTSEGEYTGGDGVSVRGQKELLAAYEEFFQETGKMEVTGSIDSIRFLSQNTAVAEGSFEAQQEKQDKPKKAGFSILYVREEGTWKIAVLREWSRETRLADLNWMIGEWSAETPGGQVRTSYKWVDGESFILMTFTVEGKENKVTGREVIGLDPATGGIRSWVFSSDGGIAEGFWAREGKTWTVQKTGVTSAGDELTGTQVFTPKDKNSFTFRTINSTVAGEELPDIGPVTVKRLQGAQ